MSFEVSKKMQQSMWSVCGVENTLLDYNIVYRHHSSEIRGSTQWNEMFQQNTSNLFCV